jgi:hypothetical protein
MELLEQLYLALRRNGSCSCCRPIHRNPTPEDPRTLTEATKCARCAALERYAQEMGIEEKIT